MPTARGQTGFQPPARDAERRAFFDLLRRVKALEDRPVDGGGGTGGVGYVHNQGVAAASWVIVHNLGYFPNVTVEDSTGVTIEGEIVHNTANQLTLTFSGSFSGVAYLS